MAERAEFPRQQPAGDAVTQAILTVQKLYHDAQKLGDRQLLLQVIGQYRSEILPLTPRLRRPYEWALTQNDIGNALTSLATRETGRSRLQEALGAYDLALEEWTRESAPEQWALVSNNMANALLMLGKREPGIERFQQAAELYAMVQQIWTLDENATGWVIAQNSLAHSFAMIGSREVGTAQLQKAVVAWDLCLEAAAKIWPANLVEGLRQSQQNANREIEGRRLRAH